MGQLAPVSPISHILPRLSSFEIYNVVFLWLSAEKPTCWLAQRCMDSLWPSSTEMNSSRSQRPLKVIESSKYTESLLSENQAHQVRNLHHCWAATSSRYSRSVLFTQMKVPRFLKTIITSSFYCYIKTLLTHVWAVTLWRSIMILSFLQCHNAWVSRTHKTLLNKKIASKYIFNITNY